MKKPPVVRPDDDFNIVGSVFNTPLVVIGRTWLPVTQLITWPILAWVAKRRIPERSWMQSFGVGAITMQILLGSEWCHNLAHAATANMVGKPMDAIRITWGMPLLVYYDINDEKVTPRQHIIRALGGPAINILILPIAFYLRNHSREESVSMDIAKVAIGTNRFLPAVGLLPIPGLDGGPILKWSLVERGQTLKEADKTVRKVNSLFGILLAIFGVSSFKKRRWLAGSLLMSLAAIAISVALGIFREQDTI
jgi:Zn-dependent protease